MNFYCLGSAHLDIKASPLFPITLGETIPVNTLSCYGGVARNIAENLVAMGANSTLLSIVGNDPEGNNLIAAMSELGIDIEDILQSDNLPTGKYYALLSQEGNLFIATADMNIYSLLTPAYVLPRMARRTQIQHWILDSNLPAETIEAITNNATSRQKLWGIAVSAAKALKLASGFPHWHGLFLNRNELRAITQESDPYAGIRQVVKRGCRHVFVTHGSEGVLYSKDGEILHSTCPEAEVVDVTGAGDAFCAAVIYSLAENSSFENAFELGFKMARNALATKSSSLAKL